MSMTNPANVQAASLRQASVVRERRHAAARRQKIFYAVLLVIALLAPLAVYPVFLMKLLCFALFACAFNLLLGYAGLLSFGHAAFFATGGYITGYMLSSYSGLSTELGILAGTLASTVLGALFGMLAIRRQGIYFAMITLALAQLVFFVFVQAPFTGGENGLQGVPRGHLFGLVDMKNNMAMYYFVLAVFVIGFAIIQRTIHSPYGQGCSRPSARTSRAPCRSATTSIGTSCWRSSSPRRLPVWLARPRPWCSSWPR